MTPAPGSPARRIAASLAEVLERLHSRLEHGDGEAQPRRNSADTQRRSGMAKRRRSKESYGTKQKAH